MLTRSTEEGSEQEDPTNYASLTSPIVQSNNSSVTCIRLDVVTHKCPLEVAVIDKKERGEKRIVYHTEISSNHLKHQELIHGFDEVEASPINLELNTPEVFQIMLTFKSCNPPVYKSPTVGQHSGLVRETRMIAPSVFGVRVTEGTCYGVLWGNKKDKYTDGHCKYDTDDCIFVHNADEYSGPGWVMRYTNAWGK